MALALKGGMNVTVKTGGARLVLRDVLRRPLLEVELGAVQGALKRLRPGIMQVTVAKLCDDGGMQCATDA